MYWTQTLIVCFIGCVFGEKPVLRPGSEKVEKSLNDSYVVFCQSKDQSAVSWQGPKGKIPLSNGRIHVENKGSIGHGLFLDRIEAGDRGVYSCHSESKEKSSFELSVVKTSQFVNTPTVHGVNENTSTLIRCEVVGEPKPTITWLHNGVPIDDVEPKRYVVESNGLKITSAYKNDSGVFSCRALQFGSNVASVMSVDITLTVKHKPEWKESVTEDTVAYGYVTGETNLTCEAIAQPEANYTWYFKSVEIKEQTKNFKIIQEPERSVLQIQINNETFFNHYKCKAFNFLGHVSRKYELRKGEKPSPPTGFREISTSVHSAKLKIASDLPDLVGYRVQFIITRPGQEVSWDHPDFQDLPKSDTGHYELQGLLENTPYTLRVAARGPAGLSDFTEAVVAIRTKKAGEGINSSERTVSQHFFLLTIIVLVSLSAVH